MGSLYRGNARDKERKRVASIVMVLGLAIIAGEVYRYYTSYEKIVERIPTDGKLGELFAIFREKIGVTRENFCDFSVTPDSPAGWCYDIEDGHVIFLHTNYYSYRLDDKSYAFIHLFRHPYHPQEVLFRVYSSFSMEQDIELAVQKVIEVFEKFLSGQKIYDEGVLVKGYLQLAANT